MAQVTTSHFKIFDYWKDKIIEENGNVTNDITSQGIDVVGDWGEPCCWGCGKPIIGEYEKNRNREEDFDFKKLWNDKYVRSKLNRCHIVPGSLNGKDEPENLFLLCSECHLLSPDTSNARSFFRWVYSQRKKMIMGDLNIEYLFSKVTDELNQRGLPDTWTMVMEIANRGGDFSGHTLKEQLSKHVGLHATHLVESSRICATADWLQKLYLDVCLNK